MPRTGQDYLDSLRDERCIYIDGEQVDDVTTHPAFAGAARSVAELYDFAADPANRDLMTYETEDGSRAHVMYMIPRTEEDLVHRRKGLRAWSEQTLGLMGRSPDHVAGFIAGFAGGKEVFARAGQRYADNVEAFYRFARDNDLYCSYTIVPPQIDRSKMAHEQSDPHLYAGVKEERDDGIVIQGAQMLGTGAVLSDYIQLSTITPLRPGDEDYAISVMIPVSAPGVKLLSRRSYAQAANSVFDYPLSSRFDETDSLAVFDEVFVPWEHVFVYRDLQLVQDQWWETAAHVLGNNQAQIRLGVKLDFLTGLAHRITEAQGSISLPPVKGSLGGIAAFTAMFNGLVYGAEQNAQLDDYGVMVPGRAESYSVMTLQSELYPRLITMVRELCGGGLIQLPSSVEDFKNPEIAAQLERYVRSADMGSQDRVKLFKMAWDLIGSEFASRHQQYEMFYAGAPFIVKMRMYLNYDFDRAKALVDHAAAGYDLDGLTGPESQTRQPVS